MFCPHCGSKIDDKSLTCPVCGESIDASMTEYLEAEKATDSLSNVPQSAETNKTPKKPKTLLLVLAGIIVLAGIAVGVLFLTGVLPVSRTDADSQPAAVQENPETENIKTLLDMEPAELESLAAGDIVYLGKYEQDDNSENGKEDVAWLILSKEGTQYTAISKDLLDCIPYDNSQSQNQLWDECSIQRWLNNDFLSETFSNEEQALLASHVSHVSKMDMVNSIFQSVDIPIEEKVYLLNEKEAETLLSSAEDRIAAPTEYACSRMIPFLSIIIENEDMNGNISREMAENEERYRELAVERSSWWMRKENLGQAFDLLVPVVDHEGMLGHSEPPAAEYVCIRPVIKIDVGGGQQPLATEEAAVQEPMAEEPSFPRIMRVKVNELMVRTGPGTEYQAVSELNTGETVIVYDISDGWAHIYWEGMDAYVSAEYIVDEDNGNISSSETNAFKEMSSWLQKTVGDVAAQYGSGYSTAIGGINLPMSYIFYDETVCPYRFNYQSSGVQGAPPTDSDSIIMVRCQKEGLEVIAGVSVGSTISDIEMKRGISVVPAPIYRLGYSSGDNYDWSDYVIVEGNYEVHLLFGKGSDRVSEIIVVNAGYNGAF